MRMIQKREFSVRKVIEGVMSPDAGAIVAFVGTVRRDGRLRALEYEAYDEMVESKLEQLRKQAVKRFKLVKVMTIHRKGHLEVGEKVVVVACSAPHRQDAFTACDWLVSEIKRIVPIWKKEIKK